jgi:hypothetical protein
MKWHWSLWLLASAAALALIALVGRLVLALLVLD